MCVVEMMEASLLTDNCNILANATMDIKKVLRERWKAGKLIIAAKREPEG